MTIRYLSVMRLIRIFLSLAMLAWQPATFAATAKVAAGGQQVIIGNVTNSRVEISQVIVNKVLPPDVLEHFRMQNNKIRRDDKKRFSKYEEMLRINSAVQLYTLAKAPGASPDHIKAYEEYSKGRTELGEALLISIANGLALKETSTEAKTLENSLRQQVGVLARIRATKPPRLLIDPSGISVSGFGSGAYMAVQYAVAYSDTVMGIGAISGGPFGCARGSISTAALTCSCPELPSPAQKVENCIELPPEFYASSLNRVPSTGKDAMIAPLAGLKRQYIYLLAEGANASITPIHSEQLRVQYMGAGVPEEHIRHVYLEDAGNTMPTLDAGGNCKDSSPTYIGRCQYDVAGELLGWIYDRGHPLVARDDKLKGELIMFDQTFFSPTENADAGLDKVGYIYVPAQCKGSQACRLHVAFHNCRQGHSFALELGSKKFEPPFVANSGYLEWANANGIVVLFPQALNIAPDGGGMFSPQLFNPQGCWDMWGYAEGVDSMFVDGGIRYAGRKGVQLSRIHAMISYIARHR